MITQRVTVHYVDGGQKDLILDQWSMGQFAGFATKQGWHMDPSDPGLLTVLMLRYQAYAELHREVSGPRPSFDVWDRTVREVEPQADAEPADPTQPGPSGG